MIKDSLADSHNLVDNMDELISLLNSKNIDLPNKVKLKPISQEAIVDKRMRKKYDEAVEVEDDFTTQKSNLTRTTPEEFIKTHEKFYSTTGSNTKKLNRIRRNLVDVDLPVDIDKTLVKPNKANSKKNRRKPSMSSIERTSMKRKGNNGKKFNIRKLKKKFKGPLNLITNSNVPSNLENYKVPRRALDDNRLARSKHILIKTFNRYMSNPSMFIKNSGGFQDLVHLNSKFDDPHLAANLFRTGTDTFSRTIE